MKGKKVKRNAISPWKEGGGPARRRGKGWEAVLSSRECFLYFASSSVVEGCSALHICVFSPHYFPGVSLLGNPAR